MFFYANLDTTIHEANTDVATILCVPATGALSTLLVVQYIGNQQLFPNQHPLSHVWCCPHLRLNISPPHSTELRTRMLPSATGPPKSGPPRNDLRGKVGNSRTCWRQTYVDYRENLDIERNHHRRITITAIIVLRTIISIHMVIL